MRIRATLVASAVALTTVVAGASHAAPSCNLIEDKKNDTFGFRTQDAAGAYGPQEDSLDIVSGDIASNKDQIAVSLRVVKLAKTAGTSPNGLSFRVQFKTPLSPEDENLYLDARLESNGTMAFSAGARAIAANVSTKMADALGTFDFEKNEVRISVPLVVFEPKGGIKAGMKLSLAGLDQTSSRYVAVNPATGAQTAAFADVASSDKVYTAGTESCLVPGK